jgi:ketosteroid isomerase-like protein
VACFKRRSSTTYLSSEWQIWRFVLAIVGIGLINMSTASVSQETANSPELRAKEQIQAALADWELASNTGDWRRALSHYSTDAIIEFPGRPNLTYAEMLGRVDRPREVIWRHTHRVDEILVDQALAVVRLEFVSERKQPEGWQHGETIRTLQVWRLGPDHKWKIVRTLSGRTRQSDAR